MSEFRASICFGWTIALTNETDRPRGRRNSVHHAMDGEYENLGWQWRVGMSESLLRHCVHFWGGMRTSEVVFILCPCTVHARL